MSDPAIKEAHGCEECPAAVASRRAFVRDVAMGVAALLAGDALLSPARALADAAREVRPEVTRGAIRSYGLPVSDAVLVDVESQVILARWQNRVYAFSLKCPHRGARIEWHGDEQRVFCPKHKARFRPDGAHDSGRRSRDLDRYACTLSGASIAVNLDVVYRADQNLGEWQRAVVALP